MALTMTDEQFKEYVTEKVTEAYSGERFPPVIEEIRIGKATCEGCSKSTRTAYVDLVTKSKRKFVGQCVVHEDPKFHAQCEWFVCGQCPDS